VELECGVGPGKGVYNVLGYVELELGNVFIKVTGRWNWEMWSWNVELKLGNVELELGNVFIKVTGRWNWEAHNSE